MIYAVHYVRNSANSCTIAAGSRRSPVEEEALSRSIVAVRSCDIGIGRFSPRADRNTSRPV